MPWDYLIVTASNARQAAGYEQHLRIRRDLGLLAEVNEVLVVADPGGRRVGSGGSTLFCLLEVLARRAADPSAWADELAQLRILIVHAGGDSRRLPAYGPAGKVFVPVPGESDSIVPITLFDRQLPTYLALPEAPGGIGQVVITSGDVLLRFDPAEVRFARDGLTGLGCFATPERAAHHGVFCREGDDLVRLFLQKPSPERQAEAGALDAFGQAILDIGVMSFDGPTAAQLLRAFGAHIGPTGAELAGEMGQAVISHGLDFYREVCCALGTQANSSHYLRCMRESGSAWNDMLLGRLFQVLSSLPFHVRLLPRCEFLDFGTSRQVIASGQILTQQDRGAASLNAVLDINNLLGPAGSLTGSNAWVEGCRINAPLQLAGQNLLVGVDIEQPTSLPPGACADVLSGTRPDGRRVTFVRCYHVADTFKDTVRAGATFCGRPVMEWLNAVGAGPADIWPDGGDPAERTVWDALLFPGLAGKAELADWLWMLAPERASPAIRQAWHDAERFSLAEIALAADQQAFKRRRDDVHAEAARRNLPRLFRLDSRFSAAELAWAISHAADRSAWIAAVIHEAARHSRSVAGATTVAESLVYPRLVHLMGSAVLAVAEQRGQLMTDLFPGLADLLSAADREWLTGVGLQLDSRPPVDTWAERAWTLAFESFGRTMLRAEAHGRQAPRSALRSDEIVWGRAPARFDTGGGWTDTPPATLEFGGSVVNVAINLNGQPPIQAYARVIAEPVIRIASIDLGARIEVTRLDDLLGFHRADSEFGLAKAALALSAFDPEMGCWPEGATLEEMLTDFGGGIELTTLAAIPKGSGLGTSSIMGAVILAVIERVKGVVLTPGELFNSVLRLEQALTTGGGWQDQIGGAVGGAKIITTSPGLLPDARIHYLPADVIDPQVNGGLSLLYYTGITRLAKNILEEVVGRYLDRDRRAMATLQRIGELAPRVAEAMSRKDLPEYGRLLSAAWELNKQLDPDSSNPQVEDLLARVAPHIHGGKLLGAGGGGFLLMLCKSPADAAAVREMLDRDPPNPRARFFDFDVNTAGLVVTVC